MPIPIHLEADHASQAVQLLRQNEDCIAMVLMDVTDPEKGAMEALPEVALCAPRSIFPWWLRRRAAIPPSAAAL